MPPIDTEWWLCTIPPESDCEVALELMLEHTRNRLAELTSIRRRITTRYGADSTILADWNRCTVDYEAELQQTFSRLIQRYSRFT